MEKIQMVDLQGQYAKIKGEMDSALQGVLAYARFVRGPEVTAFEEELASYTGSRCVVSCASGTDAPPLVLGTSSVHVSSMPYDHCVM